MRTVFFATKTLVICCKQVIIYPSFEGTIRSNDKGPYIPQCTDQYFMVGLKVVDDEAPCCGCASDHTP